MDAPAHFRKSVVAVTGVFRRSCPSQPIDRPCHFHRSAYTILSRSLQTPADLQAAQGIHPYNLLYLFSYMLQSLFTYDSSCLSVEKFSP